MNDILVTRCHIQQDRRVAIHFLLDVDGMGDNLASGKTRCCVTWGIDGKVEASDGHDIGEGGDVVAVDVAGFLANYTN